MNPKLNKKLAVVTGGTRGIGAVIARELVENGYAVIVLARTPVALKTYVKELRKNGGEAFGFRCDISVKRQIETTFKKIEEQFGIPGIIVNNAGIGGPFHRTDEVSDQEWRRVFSTNVDSIFYICRIILPKMKRYGFGRIVNIASIQGLHGGKLSSTYSASKHAVIGYTKSIAVEWGAYGITSNAVCPGYTSPTERQRSEQKIRKQDFTFPEEIAALVLHLIRPESRSMNGGTIVIDGGLTAQTKLPN